MSVPVQNKPSFLVNYHVGEEKFKVKDAQFVKAETAEDHRIKAEIDRLKRWENHVKKHELNHALVGGSGVGAISYVYTYGPDGKKYIAGGQVSVHVPGGLSHESLGKIDKLKRATGASHDMSAKDSTSAAILAAIQRSRMTKLIRKQAIEKYEKLAMEKARENIDDGKEIFHYKKLDLSGSHLLELYV